MTEGKGRLPTDVDMLLLDAVEECDSMDGNEDLQEQYLLKSVGTLLFRNRDGFIIPDIDIYVKYVVVIVRYSNIRRVFPYERFNSIIH